MKASKIHNIHFQIERQWIKSDNLNDVSYPGSDPLCKPHILLSQPWVFLEGVKAPITRDNKMDGLRRRCFALSHTVIHSYQSINQSRPKTFKNISL